MELYEPKVIKVHPTKTDKMLMKSFHSNVKASFGPTSEKPSRLSVPMSYESSSKFIDCKNAASKVELEDSYGSKKSPTPSKAEDIYTPTLKTKNKVSPQNSSGQVGSFERSKEGNRSSLQLPSEDSD